MSKSKNKQLSTDEPNFNQATLDAPAPNLSPSEIFEGQLEYLATVKSYLEMQLQQCTDTIEHTVEQLKMLEQN